MGYRFHPSFLTTKQGNRVSTSFFDRHPTGESPVLTILPTVMATKDVQQALFPPESLSIPCMACQTFYQAAHEIGGKYYDCFSLPISVTLRFARENEAAGAADAAAWVISAS